MSGNALSSLLLGAAIVLVALAGVTLVPYSNPMVSDLGYHTACPFAPWSTITLLVLAWIAWAIRGYIRKQPG
jgi:hypothetical protein